jgi:glycosyltransferase involved in cell wall biosynthesis
VVTPVRVLYLDHCARWSGAEIALARLVPALPDAEVTVLLAEHGPLEERLRAEGAVVEVVPLAATARDLRRASVVPSLGLLRALGETVRYVARLAGELRRRRPDVVVTNSLKSSLYGGVAARLVGVPVIWHVRDHVAPDSLPAGAVTLVRLAARVLPQAVIANSASTLASLHLDRGPRRARHVEVIGDPCPPAPPAAVRRGGPLVVTMVGRLAPWKGQHLFLEAFARALSDTDDRAVVVGGALFGEDAYEASLRARVEALGLGGRVELVGHVDDVRPYYDDADLLVHASTTPEPFGQVLVEGMGAGVPVIAAAAGGPTEIVSHEVDGLLYPPGDVDALADAIRRLAHDDVLRRRLARQARRSSERYAPETIGPRTEAVYRRVTCPGRGVGVRSVA